MRHAESGKVKTVIVKDMSRRAFLDTLKRAPKYETAEKVLEVKKIGML